MKLVKKLSALLACLALALNFVACEEETPEVEAPTSKITLGEVTPTTIEITISTTNATEVNYQVTCGEQVVAKGNAEPNVDAVVPLVGLTPETVYTIDVTAKGEGGTAMSQTVITTPKDRSEVDVPVVKFEIVELTPFSVSFTMEFVNTDDDQAFYKFLPADEQISATNLLKNGIPAQTNAIKTYTESNLTPNTNYQVAVVALKGTAMTFTIFDVATPADTTPASVSIEVTSASHERVYFNITSANCEEVWYAVVPHGAGEPDGSEDDGDIIGGNRAKANCTVEMSVSDLTASTQYDIHAVACKPDGQGGRQEVRAEVVTFTTAAAPMVNTENTIEFQYGSFTRNDNEKYFTVTLQNDETNTVFSFEVHRYERWYDTYMGNYNYPRMSGTSLNFGEENKVSYAGGYDYVEVAYFKHNGVERTLLNNDPVSNAPYTLVFECMTNEYDLADIKVTVIGDVDGNTFSFHYNGPIGYPLKDVDLEELNKDNIGNLTKLHLTEAAGTYTLYFEGAMKSCQFQLKPANGTLAGSGDYKWYEVGSSEWIADGSWHTAFGGGQLPFSGGKLGIQTYDNDENGNRRYKLAVENLQVKTDGDRDGDGQVDEGLEYMDIVAEPANGGDWIVTVQ